MDKILVWSVELKANSYADDTYCGTFEDCIKYCWDHKHPLDGINARLALIETDDMGRVIDTLKFYSEVD